MSDVDSLSAYLDDIRAYPLLNRAEEMALAPRIRNGDTAALDRLVCANLRFVVSVAKKYQHRGVSLADLVSDGNLGLIRAAEKYDETKEVKFISYAVWWIRQSILEALAEQGHAVRVPVGRAGDVQRIGREANVLSHELGRSPTQQELAAGLDMSENAIASSLRLTRTPLSLDAPFEEGQDGTLLDFLADDFRPTPDDELADAGLSEWVERAMTSLRGREAQVVRMYFGFDGQESMTLEHIGAQMGITRERVRQIKAKALSRLRKSDQAVALALFQDG